MEEDGRLERQDFHPHPLSRRGPPPDDFIFHCEESGRLERHGVTRAVVSSDARHPGRFALRRAVGGDIRTGGYALTAPAVIPRLTACARRESNPHVRRHRFLGPARLPVTPPALESDRRDSNSPCDLGKVACLPLTLRSHGACPGNRTPTPSVPGRDACRCHGGQSVPGRIRTGTTDLLGIVTPAVGLRRHASRPPGSNRAIRRTKAKPHRARRRSCPPWIRTRNLAASAAGVLPD
jgi:hypothetical protein